MKFFVLKRLKTAEFVKKTIHGFYITIMHYHQCWYAIFYQKLKSFLKPHLAICEFFLFSNLKLSLRGKRFELTKVVKKFVE